jgi:hypothetical protein
MTKHEIIDVIHASKCPMLKGVDFEKMTREDVISHLQKAKCPEIMKLMEPVLMSDTSDYYKSVSIEHRKEHAQFYSNKKITDKVFETIHLPKTAKCLEPSSGSGEFLNALLERGYKDIDAVEIEKTVFDKQKDKWSSKGITLYNSDYLTFKAPHKYDLVVGNPPYFLMKAGHKPSAEVKKDYGSYFNGVPDIYGLFVVKGLQDLTATGTLSMVIPVSILTSPAFQKIRNYIHSVASIEQIHIFKELNLFEGAKVEVMVFQLKKGSPNMDYITYSGSNILFSASKVNEVKAKVGVPFKSIATAKVGNVSPDKFKAEDLTNEKSDAVYPIIYAENIMPDGLHIDKKLKGVRKQYLKKTFSGHITAPFIIMNRTLGKGKKIVMTIVKEGTFFPENHTIYIKSDKLDALYGILNDKEYQKTFVENIRGHIPAITVSYLNDLDVPLKP